ncbi:MULTISPECIES: hypothetical protein [Mesorhizobium]|uniref:hypothetical protein n=1 Tax=unclassified Mesorhizobium TaxID=325217 RepID=UPI0009B7D492|nr:MULTISPECIES: hypothetical protein [Mesorhizobium]
MKNLHDRQPVILDRACYEAWRRRRGNTSIRPSSHKQPNDHPALVGPIDPL